MKTRLTAAVLASCAVAMLLWVLPVLAVPEDSDAPESVTQAGTPGAPPVTGAPSTETVSEPAPADTAAARAGRRVFVDQNCSLCHTAYALGIGEPPEGWTPEPAPDLDETSPGPPDLSILPGMWTAALLREYLVDRVEIDGARHVTSFKGSDEDWAALVGWMLSSRADTSTVGPGSSGDRPSGGALSDDGGSAGGAHGTGAATGGEGDR